MIQSPSLLCPCACSVIQSSLTLGTFVLCLWNSPRQEYWNGLSFPPPEDLPNPGIKLMFPASPALQACSLPLRSSQALKVLTFYSRVFPLATSSFLRCVPGKFINITKVNFIALNTGSPKPFRSSAPETETITKYTYVVQSLSRAQLFVIPQTAACQASLSLAIPRSVLKFMCIESVMISNHLIFSHPLHFLLSVFPSTRVFSNALVLRIIIRYITL